MNDPRDLSDTIIVFLDIDGVLLPFGQLLFPEPQIAALCAILEVNANRTRVVLSSTWRVQPQFIQDIVNQLKQYAYQYGDGPLTHFSFFDITDPTMHSERHLEIDAWLSHQIKPPLAWVALDDEDLMLGGTQHAFEGHVIRTDSHEGLTDDLAQQAIDLLQAQLQDTRTSIR